MTVEPLHKPGMRTRGPLRRGHRHDPATSWKPEAVSLEAGLLVGRVSLMVLAGTALASAYREQFPLASFAATLLIALLVARYWARHSLDAVAYRRTLSDDRAFPGDVVRITLQVENGKLLPLPWLEVREAVPLVLRGAGDEPATSQEGHITHSTPISWHERVTWSHALECRRRGAYSIGPAEMASGDPFGLLTAHTQAAGTASLVVYPKLVPVGHLRLPPVLPQGRQRPERWIFEDASVTVGARDYRQGDSMRRIHWKATARRQRLQSRVYEPTTELAVALFLAVDTFPPSDPARPDDPFEGGVSLAASLSLHLLDSGCPVGLYANGGEAEGAGCLELAPGSSGDQAARILEALARIAQIGIVPVEAHLLETVPRLPWGASVMVIAGEQTEPLSSAAAMLRTMGHKIEVQAVVTEEESVTRETNGQKREV